MSKANKPKFVIVGGGLAGSLMATYLGRAGYEVDVCEMREDLRRGDIPGGRSINLALSHRGIAALEGVGLAEEVLRAAVVMRGRMIHSPTGKLTFQPYGTTDAEVIHSVSRAGLNQALLNSAERCPSVRLFFRRKATEVNVGTGEVECLDLESGKRSTVSGDILVSADGAFSVVRRSMQKLDRFDYSQTYLAHGYKELTIAPGPGGTFRMEQNALHIWPRRRFMMIALPNLDGSFTCTLFWPFEGPCRFEALRSEQDVKRFFQSHFPDAVALLPTLVEDYFHNPTGSLVTIRCGPWFYRDRVVLLGDACHAVVPFYGQGMNAAFEDVLVFEQCRRQHEPDWQRVFETYYLARKRHVDILADLAIQNFVEMRDHTGSRRFLLRKKTEKALHKMFPRWYVPLYNMVSHTRIPYGEAVKRARRQNRTVVALVVVLVVAGSLMLGWMGCRTGHSHGPEVRSAASPATVACGVGKSTVAENPAMGSSDDGVSDGVLNPWH